MVNYVWKKPEATHVWDELIPLAADYGDTTRQKKKEKKYRTKQSHHYNLISINVLKFTPRNAPVAITTILPETN